MNKVIFNFVKKISETEKWGLNFIKRQDEDNELDLEDSFTDSSDEQENHKVDEDNES